MREMEGRLFTKGNILISESVLASGNLHTVVEHELVHRRIGDETVKKVLETGFDAMMFIVRLCA